MSSTLNLPEVGKISILKQISTCIAGGFSSSMKIKWKVSGTFIAGGRKKVPTASISGD
jgi:hypothetical protein